jgi:putative nucleotidyltransferase with HDIG domain
MSARVPGMPGLPDELLGLPVQPVVAEQVVAWTRVPGAPFDELAGLAEWDPALAVRLLRIANAAHRGAARRVGNVRQAISLLGPETVRGVCVAAVSAQIEVADPATRVPEGFWRHSLSTAAACSVIADRIGYATHDAFTVGLLHDVGAAILHQRDAVAFAAAGLRTDTRALAEAEVATFGSTHARAGADALAAWSLPLDVVEAAALHQGEAAPSTFFVSRIVRAGEALALTRIGAPGHPTGNGTTAEARLEALLDTVHLDVTDLPALHSAFDAELDWVCDLFAVERARSTAG